MQNQNLHLNFNNQIRVQTTQRDLLHQTDSTETIDKIASEIKISTQKFEAKKPGRLYQISVSFWRLLFNWWSN